MPFQYQSVGLIAVEQLTTGGDTLAAGAPSGVSAGDLLLCAVLSRQTPVTVAISGYELLDTQGRLSVFGRIATGTDDTPVVSVNVSTTSYCLAQYARFTGSLSTIGTAGATIRDQAAAETGASANDIATGSQSTPSVDGCLILYVGGKLNDLGAYSALPNASTIIASTANSTANLHLIWSYAIQTTAASVGASSFDFADDANTYYSTVLTLKPSASTKYLKLLAAAAAASAADVEGVVLNAARDTVIGEFSGQAFEASLEGGEAVLLIPTADITPDGDTLTTSDTPIVFAYNSTDATIGPGTATVIEV